MTFPLGQAILPYNQAPTSSFSLNKIIFTNEPDSKRYSIQLNDEKHVSLISKIVSSTQEECTDLISYIQNPTSESLLLVKIDSAFFKIKLNVLITRTKSEDKSIIIVKSLLGDVDVIQEKLIHNDKSDVADKSMEISKLEYRKLPIDMNSLELRVVINDSFLKKFENQNLNVLLWEYDNAEKQHHFLFRFGVWVGTSELASLQSSEDSSLNVQDYPEKPVSPKKSDEVELATPVKSDPPATAVPNTKAIHEAVPTTDAKTINIKSYKNHFNFNVEDGPKFRSALAKYEASLPFYKKSCSNILEELKKLDQMLKLLSASKSKLISLFTAFSEYHPTVKQIGFPHDFEIQLKSIFDPFERNLKFFLVDVCDLKLIQKIQATVSDVYESSDQKKTTSANELQKKQFESTSKDYYGWLNKYLSNEKERPELKLLTKRKVFELAKFDYLNHLSLITNNQYVNRLLEGLFKFTAVGYRSRLLDFEKFKTKGQLLLKEKYQIYLNVVLRFNSEKYQFRQMIEACTSNEELSKLIQYHTLNQPNNEHSHLEISKENLGLVFSKVPSREDQNPDMSGILYALGGQGKPGWHKEWVVLLKGQLIEFSNWRKGTSPVNKPIEVALSSVKSISHEKRQFCFEIFTSNANKHVFQAINEAERTKWIKALYNAGQVVNTKRLKGKNLKLTTDKLIIAGMDRSTSPVLITSKSLKIKDYFNLVKSIPDSDNSICLDCGSKDSVEWVSINFLNCFCVKCALSHRSLGSHITKIRSLKLDKFESELEMLLAYTNNRKVNSYLEANLTDKKPSYLSTPDERLQFIRKKYVEKKYKLEISEPNNKLIRSVQKIDIAEVLKCISCQGDINLTVEILLSNQIEPKVVSLFEYSLRKYVEDQRGDKFFVISELLLLNGCKVEKKDLPVELGLSEEALEFWKKWSLKLF